MLLRALVLLCTALVAGAETYQIGPDSERHPGVPQGRLEHSEFNNSKIYPGTTRDVWVYVPAQYDASKPAALMVFQDGHSMINTEGDRSWMTPIVLDNLIHQGAMPVTIGVFVKWGLLPAHDESQRERYNRSYEYDAMGDRYVRFLIEELLPDVEKKYNLTDDPNLRGIGGSSSGGIAAFTAAWERPDYFRRVLSFVGSFTNLRGGDTYPGLIRKFEPKPLRVFMQDGTNDNNIYSGSWWISNQDVADALRFAGYDYKFVTGEEAHNNRHGRAILPDALRWLWRDADKPILPAKTVGDRQYVQMFLDPNEDWELVSKGHEFTEGPALAPNGDVYFSDTRANKVFRIDAKTSKVSLFEDNTEKTNGLMFGPDGRLYGCRREAKQIVSWDVATKRRSVVSEGTDCNDLVVTAKGSIYYTDPTGRSVMLITKDGALREVVGRGIERPNGVMLSPDQSLLTVVDTWNKWAWSYRIAPDGSLADGQPFYRLETSDESSRSGGDGMTIESEGHLLVATSMGVQICDQPGRVIGIIRKPQPGSLSNLVFAGPQLKTLYATAGDKVFRRKLQVSGVKPWEPVKPPQPGL